MKTPPRRRGILPDRQVREADQESKPPIKTKPPGFEALAARYYRSTYRLALQITEDPLEAALLTRYAFNRTRKQFRSCWDEATIATMLVAAVIQGLNSRDSN